MSPNVDPPVYYILIMLSKGAPGLWRPPHIRTIQGFYGSRRGRTGIEMTGLGFKGAGLRVNRFSV